MKIPDLIILNKFIYKLPAVKIGISALEGGTQHRFHTGRRRPEVQPPTYPFIYHF